MNPFSTSITAVTVYPDRARVKREGRAMLEAGLHQLEIAELPLQMNEEVFTHHSTRDGGLSSARCTGSAPVLCRDAL